jgi:hypothetical protein
MFNHIQENAMEKKPQEFLVETSNTRRDFLKYSSLLGSAALLAGPVWASAATEAGKPPEAAPQGAGAGGGAKPVLPDFKPEEIGKAMVVLFKTYSRTMPYQHKFNDALIKSWLTSLDFAVAKKEQKDFVEHYINTMKPILQRGKAKVAASGPEAALTTMFEGTMCSVQLFEEITVKPGERIFPCPYKGILDACRPLKMFSIEWKDVCSSFCIPLYTGFGKELGVEIKMTPGEICSARI